MPPPHASPHLPARPAPHSFASVYQMLRGTLVIFAGLLTIVLLRRRLHSHHWCAHGAVGPHAAGGASWRQGGRLAPALVTRLNNAA